MNPGYMLILPFSMVDGETLLEATETHISSENVGLGQGRSDVCPSENPTPRCTPSWTGTNFGLADAPVLHHDKQPPMIFRPISPSTLMALTEPCLMVWCDTAAEDLSIGFLSASYGSQTPHHLVPATALHTKYSIASTGHNMWGY